MSTFLTGAGVIVLVMAVPLAVGFALGLVRWHGRSVAIVAGALGWALLVYDGLGVTDETNPPAWMWPAIYTAVLVVPYVFGLLLAIAVRPSSRGRGQLRLGA